MPQVLLDQNEMAKGFKYFAIGDFASERRRQLPRVCDRHDRLSPIHASDQRSQDRQNAAGQGRACDLGRMVE